MFVENYRDLIDKDMGGASPRRVGRADSTSVSAYLYALLFTDDAAISLPLVPPTRLVQHYPCSTTSCHACSRVSIVSFLRLGSEHRRRL